jgi:multidrug efflux system membrane fusion protein
MAASATLLLFTVLRGAIHERIRIVGRIRLTLLAILAVVIVGAVYLSVDGDVAAPPAAASPPVKAAQPAAVDNSPTQRAPAIAVTTAVAVSEDVPITTDSVGWVEPIATVAIKTRIDGVILAQAPTEGQMVQKGDVLYRLDDAPIQAVIAKDQATISKDQANLDQANADLARDQSLIGKNDVITQQQFQQQIALVKADQAQIAIDKAQLQADQIQLAYTNITAPIAGRVGVISATPGNLVHAADSTPLLTITQMAPLRISYAVPERDLDAYRTALAGANPVPVEALDPLSARPRASGRLTFIDSSVDTASGTVVLKAEFANADGSLWPGEYNRVRTQLGVRTGATVVPTVAIEQNNQGPFVFLASPNGAVKIQQVTIADALTDTSVITSGLKPGDRVVVEGQLRLSDGAPIKEASANAGKTTPAAPANVGGKAP